MQKFTRRQLAAAIPASAALLAQTPPPPPQDPAGELKAAQDQLRQNLQQLAGVELPMSTEPASHFRP